MIVRDIMTTKLITVSPEDTLARAANLLRQYQFHHLPVTRSINIPRPAKTGEGEVKQSALLFEGMLTAQDINLAAMLAEQDERSGEGTKQRWQERRVAEMMHRGVIRVTPITAVAAAAQILVERNLNYLPVVQYVQLEQDTKTTLVGLLTRSDLLLVLARLMGAYQPGTQVDIVLPLGDVLPLARMLQLIADLHIPVRSVIVAPQKDGVPNVASVRVGTINPTALLVRLQAAGIQYSFGDPPGEGEQYG